MCSYFSHVVRDPQEQPTLIRMCMSSLYFEPVSTEEDQFSVLIKSTFFIFQNRIHDF